MKDKLYKNHHRGIYYRFRRFLLIFVIFASSLTIAIVPTYIVLKDAGNKKETHAVDEPAIQETEKEDHDSEKEVGEISHFDA